MVILGLSLKMQGSQTHVSNVQHGTTGYMAPEVEEEGSTSKAADVYAFGVVCKYPCHIHESFLQFVVCCLYFVFVFTGGNVTSCSNFSCFEIFTVLVFVNFMANASLLLPLSVGDLYEPAFPDRGHNT